MKRLILVRHAKSSWANSDLPDKDRPLNERGRGAAGKIGRWLSRKGYQPQQVISSDALRCRETWEIAAGELAPVADVRFERLLYLASADEIFDVLRTANADDVLLLGHMPGIGDFVRRLRRDPPPFHDMFQKYPTAATTVLEFRTDIWDDLQMGTGVFLDYVIPRDLNE